MTEFNREKKMCRNCIHFNLCLKNLEDELEGFEYIYNILILAQNREGERCEFFKDKSQIIELPNVEIDQELFYIDEFTRTVESDIVSRLTWEQTDLGIQTGIWSENNGFSEFFSDIGKTLFLTKEEAEAKLKEVKK